MKKIGEGYFYNVYDCGNGRVMKKIKSTRDRFFTIARFCGFVPTLVYTEFTRSSSDRKTFESI